MTHGVTYTRKDILVDQDDGFSVVIKSRILSVKPN